MLIDLQLFLFLLLICLLLYWAVPASQPRLRAVIVVAVSTIAVNLASPIVAVLCLVSTGLARLAGATFRRRQSSAALTVLVGAQIALILLPDVVGLLKLRESPLVYVGLAFFGLKSIAATVDCFKYQKEIAFLDLLLLNIFFPIFSAGPVEQPDTFAVRSLAAPFNLGDQAAGMGRMLLGIFKHFYLAREIVDGYVAATFPADAADLAQLDPGSAYVYAALHWLSLFLSFSGYTDIAVGAGRLFGVRIRENFNMPYLARSIQEYWQRWHMSLMGFMSKYVYMSFVRRTGWRVAGIFVVFLCAGFWHALSPNYLFWALAHGSALAGFTLFQRSNLARSWHRVVSLNRPVAVAHDVFSRVVTLSFVFIVSAVGTAPSWEFGAALLWALVP